jgi:hypothetical protein
LPITPPEDLTNPPLWVGTAVIVASLPVTVKKFFRIKKKKKKWELNCRVLVISIAAHDRQKGGWRSLMDDNKNRRKIKIETSLIF